MVLSAFYPDPLLKGRPLNFLRSSIFQVSCLKNIRNLVLKIFRPQKYLDSPGSQNSEKG